MRTPHRLYAIDSANVYSFAAAPFTYIMYILLPPRVMQAKKYREIIAQVAASRSLRIRKENMALVGSIDS